MIHLIHGSIFDSKCDLLIVPCDSGGGVTHSVYTNLHERGLPTMVGHIPYGKVHFRESRYEFASTIGYAASVNANTITSEAEAISQIAGEIVRYATANQIRIVNIPLLGSGAGGMTPVDSFEALRSILAAEKDIIFNVFCFTREAYRNLSAARKVASEEKPIPHPRVFISYTGTNKNNASWVKLLATALREHGVDARLDAFHLKPGFDLPQWMANEVIMAEKVLLVCDKYYMEKADFRKGGVGWETMVIQGDMLAQGDNKRKYIAIIREDAADEALPIYMKSKYAFDWGKESDIDPERLKELVLCIFDCDTEPELGEVPTYVKQKIHKNGTAEPDRSSVRGKPRR
ncbi:MAG: TIR domain-containing protein [Candidatus Eisenbacteria bacterium]|nr:TIR domain-containing protein [Candidatus Eisenbacteria bacterium]